MISYISLTIVCVDTFFQSSSNNSSKLSCVEPNCKTTFATKYNLHLHMLKHKQQYKHICSDCGKGFMNSNHLKTHQNAHLSIKPYECYKCRKGFCSTSALKRHQVSCAIMTKDYDCVLCGKLFSTNDNLRRHLTRVHSTSQKDGWRYIIYFNELLI